MISLFYSQAVAPCKREKRGITNRTEGLQSPLTPENPKPFLAVGIALTSVPCIADRPVRRYRMQTVALQVYEGDWHPTKGCLSIV